MSQYSLSRPDMQSVSRLQTRLTARAGIWHGLAMLNSQSTQDDQDQTIDTTTESLFMEDLWTGEDEDAMEDDTVRLLLVDQPIEVVPFTDTSYGKAILHLGDAGLMRHLSSLGVFRDQQRKISVLLGSRPITSPDTVLYLQTPDRPHGLGIFDGVIGLVPVEVDSGNSNGGAGRRHRFAVNSSDLNEYIEDHSALLAEAEDTAFEVAPFRIAHGDDLDSIPEMIDGDLLIDATFHTIQWAEDRTIHVLKDLQIDGDVLLEGLTFNVGGEIRLGVDENFSSADEIQLRDVTLFSRSRIFFARNVIFEGSAMALGDVEIYSNAQIVNKSVIASNGEPGKNKGEEKARGQGASGANPAKPSNPFTIYVRDEATVDGVLLNLNSKGGIKIEPQTELRGILWAEGSVCHEGRLDGAVKAKVLVSSEETTGTTRNIMDGSVRSLDNIGEYHLPYFIGELTILEWRE
ncbi:MAG: hypothetical protein GF363_02170 [Chitinivibrionales bacterium]|nr:hypothetical protein [Chitinivibrionales bacterium]